MKIYLFLPCFPATKNSQSCKVRPRLARSAENFEYLVLILAKMIINGRKTGKKRPNRAKTGKISGFHFSCSALFLPCFLETLFLPHPRGGGYWPKYLPLLIIQYCTTHFFPCNSILEWRLDMLSDIFEIAQNPGYPTTNRCLNVFSERVISYHQTKFRK